jgi:hypothetical protein
VIRRLFAALVILGAVLPTQVSADDRKLYAYFHAICVATDGSNEATVAAIRKYGFEPLDPIPSLAAPYFPPGARLFQFVTGDDETVLWAGTMTFHDAKAGPVRTCLVGGSDYSDWLFEAVAGLAGVPMSAVASRPETRQAGGDFETIKRRDAYAFIKGPTGHRPLPAGGEGAPTTGPDERLIAIDASRVNDFSITTLSYVRPVEPEE